MKLYVPRPSLTVKAVIGVNAGYNHNNANGFSDEEMAKYVNIWDNIMNNDKEFGFTNYYPAIFSPLYVGYKKEWGCPEGGEKCLLVSVTVNPIFVDIAEELKDFPSSSDFARLIQNFGFPRETKKDRILKEILIAMILFANRLGNEAITIEVSSPDVAYAQEIQDLQEIHAFSSDGEEIPFHENK